MDPVSHVILGRTIVAALENPTRTRFGRHAGAAAILGALSPDIDCVLMPAGWDIYLRFHEIGTHSVAGSIAVGCVAAAGVRAWARGGRYGSLATAAVLGALSHLFLDVISGARLGLAWPLDGVRVTWPLVAMAEPWLIAMLTVGAAALWFGRRQRLRRHAWLLLIAVAVSLAVRASLYARVRHLAGRELRVTNTASEAIEAKWGSWTKWNVFEKDMERLRTWEVDGWTGARDLRLSWPLRPEPPLVAASRALETVDNFLRVHDLVFAVERATGDGARAVLWSDIRYCQQRQIETGEPDCGLWFGGTFAADGQAISQEVDVGGWIQRRPVSP